MPETINGDEILAQKVESINQLFTPGDTVKFQEGERWLDLQLFCENHYHTVTELSGRRKCRSSKTAMSKAKSGLSAAARAAESTLKRHAKIADKLLYEETQIIGWKNSEEVSKDKYDETPVIEIILRESRENGPFKTRALKDRIKEILEPEVSVEQILEAASIIEVPEEVEDEFKVNDAYNQAATLVDNDPELMRQTAQQLLEDADWHDYYASAFISQESFDEDPLEIFGIEGSYDERVLRQRYRVLAMQAHPDREGGSVEAMQRLNWARDQLLSNL